ncbi:MAG: carboxypeptidase regulatory-like domain-containing protein [Planctomycetes bacterium]|nr:carboxypeptidase regulatory-like domain-containing protein [Planctomycetota bacterium]
MRSRPPLLPLLALAAVCLAVLAALWLRARTPAPGLARGSAAEAALDARGRPGLLESADAPLPLAESTLGEERAQAQGTQPLPADSDEPPPEARVEGRVLQPDGRPAVLARVQYVQWLDYTNPESLPEDSTVTDEQGAFSIFPAPTGKLRLVALSSDFAASQTLSIELEPGEHKRDVRLELREFGRIRGLVLDAQSAPRAGVALSCEDLDTRKALFTQSDAAGRFVFERVNAGSQLVSIRPRKEELDDIRVDAPFLANFLSNGDQERFLEIAAGQTLEIVLGGILADGVRVFGHVSALGQPLARTWIWPENPDTGWFDAPRVRSDELGAYELRVRGKGTYTFHLMGMGGTRDLVRTVEITQEKQQVLDFDLPGADIHGRVVDAAGRPVTEVNLSLDLVSPPADAPASAFDLWMPHCTPGPDGRFSFVNLPAGRYEILANPISKPDAEAPFARARVQVEVPGAQLEIVLGPGCVLRGLVRGAPEGLNGALRVIAYDEPGGPVAASARVDPDGSFVLRGLSEGRYGLRATGANFDSPIAAPIEVRADREREVELTVEPAGRLLVAAKWPSGERPPELTLRVRDLGGHSLFDGTSHPSVLLFLGRGTYELELTGPGGWRGNETAALESGAETRIEVLVKRAK